MVKIWSELSPEQRREERFKKWLSPEGIEFKNHDAEKLYKERVTRILDAINLKEPDRVPAIFSPGHAPARYSGYTVKDVMYDPEKIAEAWGRYINDFELDVLPSANTVRCGKALDILDSKMFKWAGHGLSDDYAAQYVDAEYLKEDEWGVLKADPSDFRLRTYLPRVFGAAEPLDKLPPLSSIGSFHRGLAVFADETIQGAFKTLGDAGREENEWRKKISEVDRRGMETGLPRFYGATFGAGAPLDNIGAEFRGTKGTVMDMFRQPEKLIECMEDMIPESIRRGAAMADISGVPIVFMPLHRGADGFMSENQFTSLYWPYLKRMIMGYIEEGLVPWLFAEGGYDSRLEIIKEVPKGKVIWHFDQTDMIRAKEILGETACLMGNIPTSILVTGSQDDVKSHCKKLIETVGKGGGYIMAPGATSDDSKLENLKAILDAAKEYGVYKS
jgi:uroporphyrinogen-III decarboxylase